MSVYEVDPISRIEGHLGVKLTTSATPGGTVTDAEMHGNLWRGFENFLLGRDVNDAITFTQRICGVCPVPHGQTSTYAVDAVLGYSSGHISFPGDVPAKAVHIRNLVLASEFLMSNLTHFYHLVALDYVQGPATPPWTPFFDDSFYDAALRNPGGSKVLPTQTAGFSDSTWDATVTQYVKALRIRRLTFEAGALFAGRMPMTSCFVGGGVTNDGTEDLSGKVATFKAIMEEVGDFIIKEHVPLVLALGALYLPYDNSGNGGNGYGAGWGNFLAWGAFPDGDTGVLACPGGVYITTDLSASGTLGTGSIFTASTKAQVAANFLPGGANAVEDNLTETIINSKYDISDFDVDNIDATTMKGFPGDVQRTMPARSRGYSYIKSPRWDDTPCEVGPYARQVVHGLYPVDGSTLASGYGAYYTAYVKDACGNVGLDPAMVGVDLAVALVRDGLAEVHIGAAVYDASGIAGASGGTLAAVYGDADAVIMGTVRDWIVGLKGGLSVMDRIRARALESYYLVQCIRGSYTKATSGLAGDESWSDASGDGWLNSSVLLDQTAGSTWTTTPTISANTNYGATEAPRGALMHYATINDQGKITAYQCIVPTTWNACPKDQNDNWGPIEKAMIGIPYATTTSEFVDQSGNTQQTESQLEALRVAHTFDPCIACAVH